MPRPDNAYNFRVYATSEGVEPPFYLIESTAPNNVDDKSAKSIRDDELKKVGLHDIPPVLIANSIPLAQGRESGDAPSHGGYAETYLVGGHWALQITHLS